MIRMPIRGRRRGDERRPPRPQLGLQRRDGTAAAGEEQRREPLVGEVQEDGARRGNPETVESLECLDAPPLGPAGAGVGVHPPPPFQETLRPGIVLPVGDEDDAHRATRGDRALQESARGKRLVVGVSREDENALPRG